MNPKQILSYLDNCNFPVLGNGYYFHVDQQLTLYQNDDGWALVIQALGYNNRHKDLDGATNAVYIYSNSLMPSWKESFHMKAKTVNAFVEDPETSIPSFKPSATTLEINGKEIVIERSVKAYKIKGIALEKAPNIQPWEFLRFITPEHSDLFWLTKDELSPEIPPEMEEIISIRHWDHPDTFDTEPSDTQSFKTIAEAIASRNYDQLEKIDSNESNNTHWKFYPQSGKL